MIHPPQVRPEEPIAVTPHDGICGGESQQWLSYPTNLHVRVCEGRGWQHPRLLGEPLVLPSSSRDRLAYEQRSSAVLPQTSWPNFKLTHYKRVIAGRSRRTSRWVEVHVHHV